MAYTEANKQRYYRYLSLLSVSFILGVIEKSRDELDKILEFKRKENMKNYSAAMLAEQKDVLMRQKQEELEKQRRVFRENILSNKLLSDKEERLREMEEQRRKELSFGRTIEEGMLKRSQEFIQEEIRKAKERASLSQGQYDAPIKREERDQIQRENGESIPKNYEGQNQAQRDYESRRLVEDPELRRKAMEHNKFNGRSSLELDRRVVGPQQQQGNRPMDSMTYKQRLYEENALVQEIERENRILSKIKRDEELAWQKEKEEEENRRRARMEAENRTRSILNSQVQLKSTLAEFEQISNQNFLRKSYDAALMVPGVNSGWNAKSKYQPIYDSINRIEEPYGIGYLGRRHLGRNGLSQSQSYSSLNPRGSENPYIKREIMNQEH